MNVLFIEDEAKIADFVRAGLKEQGFTVDYRDEVTCDRPVIELTSREFNLLEYLMRSPGRVFTRTQILEHIWGYDFNPSTNVVDVCIQRIRKKIDFIDRASWIESIRGVGYRFRQPDSRQ